MIVIRFRCADWASWSTVRIPSFQSNIANDLISTLQAKGWEYQIS